MERSAWTDERLDDLAASIDQRFTLLHEEVRALRTEMHDEFRELRGDLSAWQRQIAQIGWALVVALIGAIVALIVAVA
jgi:predicted phage gp36 major capsid-like protein